MNNKGEQLYELAQFAASCSDGTQIYQHLRSVLAEFGVAWVNYAFGTENNFIFYSNMDDNWLNYYMDHYVVGDYLVHHCTHYDQPLKFGPNYLDLSFVKNIAPEAYVLNQHMFEDGWDVGIRGGLAVPLNSQSKEGTCGAGVLFDLPEKDTQEAVQQFGDDIVLMTQVAHAYISQKELRAGEDIISSRSKHRMQKNDFLTQREKDVLSYLAVGERPDRIAEKMKIKLPTVHLHITKARRRLGARTREQTIVEALKTRQLVL